MMDYEYMTAALEYDLLHSSNAECAVCGKTEDNYGSNILYEDPRGWVCCFCLEEEGK